MIRKTSAFVFAALLIAACSNLSTDLPPLAPIGIVTVRSFPDATPSGYSAKAYGYFFSERGFSFSDSRFASNTCVGPQPLISTGGTSPSAWLDPGSPTTFTLTGTSGVAPRTVQLVQGAPSETDAHVFENISMPTVYPGTDTSVITVPGAAGGFPALSVRAATVQDFTFETVADSAPGPTGLPIRWSAATLPNTAMEVALVYKASASSTDLDTQLTCTLVDDGEFLVPRQFLDGWYQAGDDTKPLAHEIRYTRYITGSTTVGDASLLLINTLDHTQQK